MSEENLNQQQNLMPEIESPEDIDRKELERYWLDPQNDYPEPHYMLEYRGVGFSPFGGIQALSGQKKNGKTWVICMMIAATLGESDARQRPKLPGLKMPERTLQYLRELHNDQEYKPCVLYVDTEMEQLNTAKVLRRVHWLCGFDMRQKNERFHVLWLRSVKENGRKSANDERRRLILNAIDEVKPDAVFIDGIRDIINDFNDNSESASLVGELMRIAQEKGICIWNVLHMNPRPSNDDESKMRGHLGTELGNKVTDTFISTKHKDAATNKVTFTVKQIDARGKDIDDFKFEIGTDAGGLGIPHIIKQGDDRDKVVEANDTLGSLTWPRSGLTYTEIRNKLGIKSNRKADELRDLGLSNHIITQNGQKYFYVGLGKDAPNDSPEDIPFEPNTNNEDAPF